jgi:hypothetical protein
MILSDISIDKVGNTVAVTFIHSIEPDAESEV